jgi:hypothetical protein
VLGDLEGGVTVALKNDFVDADVAATVHAAHHNALATNANKVTPPSGYPLIYVDSVNGVDGNSGLVVGDAKATIGAAITTLPATGGSIGGVGTFIETVTLPVWPKIVNLIPLGSRRSFIIQPAAANQPAITCASGAVQDGVIKCAVKAHTSGSTGAAVEMDGMRNMLVDVEFLSNGTGNFAQGCLLLAATACYRNTIRPMVTGQSGPASVVAMVSDSLAHNANINRIVEPYIYNNSGITTVFDCGDSTLTEIVGGLVESNSGAVVLIPGNFTKFSSTWLESNATASIVPSITRRITPNNVVLDGVYFSSAQTLTIPSGVAGWKVWSPSSLTITDNGSNNQTVQNLVPVPTHAQVRLDLAIVTGAVSNVGTWASPQFGTNLFMRYNSSATLDDSTTFGVKLSDGTYSVELVADQGPDAAIVTVQIDGASVGTMDLYNASARVYLVGISSVSIAEGYHAITLLAASKNASSSSYTMRLGYMVFTRTA